MNRIVILALLCCCLNTARSQHTDLPGPSANLQTLEAGSYVIAMDNTLQLNASSLFNIKAYGLVVHLLHNNVRLSWVIKAGKAKDGTDFTANASELKPTASTASSKNFKAGPFIIQASDTTGVAALIESFYTANALTGANRPKVYKTISATVDVDIRYDLGGFVPKAAILMDGGRQSIHLAYMQAASVPAAAYTTSNGTDLLTSCFTFASEPHNTQVGAAVDSAIVAIKNFVTKGGNFLAQCEAVRNYESNTLGRFQTTGGVTSSSTLIYTSVDFVNPDLGYTQLEGSIQANHGGSLQLWISSGGAQNNEHDHIRGQGANSTLLAATVSKHYYLKGGMVFYMGNHDYTLTSDQQAINGLRMYMNAFLTPSNSNCPIQTYQTLPLTVKYFNGSIVGKQHQLKWELNDVQELKDIELQRSTDGQHFEGIRTITGLKSTIFNATENRLADRTYYRLKIRNKQGFNTYSAVIMLDEKPSNRSELKMLANDGGESMLLNFYSSSNTTLDLVVVTAQGHQIAKQSVNCIQGANILSIPVESLNQSGLYLVHATNTRGERFDVKTIRIN